MAIVLWTLPASAYTGGNGNYWNFSLSGGVSYYHAPVVYYDPAATPLSTNSLPIGSVTAGNTYGPYEPDSAQFYYECIQSGTTVAATTPDVFASQLINTQVTIGTAVFIYRAHQGWSRAAATYRYYGSLIYDTQVFVPSTASFQSNVTSYTPGTSTLITDRTKNTLISVTKNANNIISTYTPGATYVSVNTTYNYAFVPKAGLVRGMTMGRLGTDTTASGGSSMELSVLAGCRIYGSTMNAVTPSSAGYAALFLAGQIVQTTVRNNSPAPSWMVGHGSWSNRGYLVGSSLVRGATADAYSILRATGGAVDTYAMDVSGVAGTPPALSVVETNTYTSTPAVFSSVGTSFPTYTYTPRNRWRATNTSAGSTHFAQTPDYDLEPYPSNIERSTTTYRTGGAADGIGPFSSRTVISGVNEPEVATIWFYNSKVDEGFIITVEIAVTIGAGMGITDICKEDVWMDAIYLSRPNSAYPGRATTRTCGNEPALYHLSAVVNYLPVSTATWTGLPADTIKRKLQVTVSPRRAGPIKLVIGAQLSPWTMHRYADTSMALYIDPRPTLEAAP